LLRLAGRSGRDVPLCPLGRGLWHILFLFLVITSVGFLGLGIFLLGFRRIARVGGSSRCGFVVVGAGFISGLRFGSGLSNARESASRVAALKA
jgi:hypothetical protein